MKKCFQTAYELLCQTFSRPDKGEHLIDQQVVAVNQLAMFLALAGLLIGQTIAQMLLTWLPDGAPLEWQFGISLIPVQVIAFGAGLLGLAAAGKQLDWRALLGWQPMANRGIGREIAEVACLILLMIPLLWGINYAASLFCTYLGIPTPPQALQYFAEQKPGTLFWVLASFSMVVWAPIAEEIIFRLIFYRALAGIWPRKAATVTSVLFALLHYRIQYFPGLFFLGMAFQAVFIRGGIRQAILAHAFYNFCSLLMFCYFQYLLGQ